MTGRSLVGADLRAALGRVGVQAVNRRLGDPALPKPNIIGDDERSGITPICYIGDDSIQSKQI